VGGRLEDDTSYLKYELVGSITRWEQAALLVFPTSLPLDVVQCALCDLVQREKATLQKLL